MGSRVMQDKPRNESTAKCDAYSPKHSNNSLHSIQRDSKGRAERRKYTSLEQLFDAKINTYYTRSKLRSPCSTPMCNKHKAAIAISVYLPRKVARNTNYILRIIFSRYVFSRPSREKLGSVKPNKLIRRRTIIAKRVSQ